MATTRGVPLSSVALDSASSAAHVCARTGDPDHALSACWSTVAHSAPMYLVEALRSWNDLRDWVGAFDLVELRGERGELMLSAKPDGRPVVREAWAALIRK